MIPSYDYSIIIECTAVAETLTTYLPSHSASSSSALSSDIKLRALSTYTASMVGGATSPAGWSSVCCISRHTSVCSRPTMSKKVRPLCGE